MYCINGVSKRLKKYCVWFRNKYIGISHILETWTNLTMLKPTVLVERQKHQRSFLMHLKVYDPISLFSTIIFHCVLFFRWLQLGITFPVCHGFRVALHVLMRCLLKEQQNCIQTRAAAPESFNSKKNQVKCIVAIIINHLIFGVSRPAPKIILSHYDWLQEKLYCQDLGYFTSHNREPLPTRHPQGLNQQIILDHQVEIAAQDVI